MLNLSLQMYGCRVIQKGLEAFTALPEQQIEIVKELEGHVLKVQILLHKIKYLFIYLSASKIKTAIMWCKK